MDSFLKSVFVRAGKHTSVHDVHPHINSCGFPLYNEDNKIRTLVK